MSSVNHGSRLSRRSLVKGAAGVGAAAVALKGASSAFASGGSAPTLPRYGRQSNTEIVFSHIWGTPPGAEAATSKHPVELVIEAFNAKNTGVTVKGRTDATNYYDILQKAQAEMAAGNGPALVMTPWSNINYASEGLGVNNLEDIAAVAGGDASEVLGNIKPEVITLAQLDGKTKGVPYALSCPVIYVNNDILATAGVDPAALLATWASVLEQGPAIKSATGNPVIGFATNRDWPAQGIIQSNGGVIVNEAGELAFDSPEAVAALQAIADLNEAGIYYNSTSAEVRPSFIAGALPIMQSSIGAVAGVRKDATFDFSVYPFPKFAEKQRIMNTGGSFIGCYARDEDQQKAAWEFLKFAVSEEGTAIWMQTGYLNSTIFDMPVLPGQEAAYEQLNEGVTRETAWPGSRGAEMQKLWEDYVVRIWTGDISAEDGVKEAKQELSALM